MSYRRQRYSSSEGESDDDRSVASSRRSGSRQTCYAAPASCAAHVPRCQCGLCFTLLQARPTSRAEVFRCQECLREFSTRQGLSCHITTTHERARASRDEPALEAFGKLSIRKASERFPCAYCDKDYANQGNLNRHMREYHRQDAGSSNYSLRSQTNIQNNVKIQNNYFYLYKK